MIMNNIDEYLRRNQIHASAIGSKAAFEVAIKRLSTMRRQPKWLMKILCSGLERAEKVCREVAVWRDNAK